MPLLAGDKLGPYEILSLIGAGGVGEVYHAKDTRLGREVASKPSKEKFSERFEREAEERCSSLCRTCSEMGDLVKWPSEACESG
jgi:serine/threonine protein kinase